jgi:hypothetical protein
MRIVRIKTANKVRWYSHSDSSFVELKEESDLRDAVSNWLRETNYITVHFDSGFESAEFVVNDPVVQLKILVNVYLHKEPIGLQSTVEELQQRINLAINKLDEAMGDRTIQDFKFDITEEF